MKPIHTVSRALLLLSFLSFFSSENHLCASHNLGGYIYSTHVSGNTYQVSVITYTDPSIANVERCTIDLSIWRIDGGEVIVTRLNDIPRVNGPVSSAQIRDCNLSTFNDGEFVYGTFKKNLYQVEYEFPEEGMYEVRFFDKNRSTNIVNINVPEQIPLYLGLKIQVTNNQVDNSPVFLNEGVVDHACTGSTWTHNPGIFDSDGDSLVVSLHPALQYDPPTISSPIPVSDYRFPNDSLFGISTFTFDSTTGFMVWDNPQQAGTYILVYQVDAYKSGVLTTSNFREISILVTSCAFNPPIIQSNYDPCIQAGENTQIAIEAYDPDVSDSLVLHLNNAGLGNNGPFSVLSSQAPTISGEIVDPTGNTSFTQFPVRTKNNGSNSAPDTIKAILDWVPDCADMNKEFQVDIFARDNKANFQAQLMRTDHELLKLKVSPPRPKDVQMISTNPNVVELDWTAPLCPVMEYRVYRRIDSTNWNPLACADTHPNDQGYSLIARILPSAPQSFVDIPANQMSSTLCYVVTAVFTGNLESSASTVICVNDYTTGIDDLLPSPLQKISPNPTTDRIQVSLFESPTKPLTYALYSLDGKKWKEGKLHSKIQQLSMTGLPVGVYFLQLDGHITQRILKVQEK